MIRAEVPDGRPTGNVCLGPRSPAQSEGRYALEHSIQLQNVLVSRPAGLWGRPVTPESKVQIREIVPHEAASVFAHPHIERVTEPNVGVVSPGRKDPKSPQLAPVLVRKHVVPVVRPGPLKPEGTNASLNIWNPGCQHAIRAVGAAGGGRE